MSADTARDDRATIIAIAVLACVLQDALHEGVGHGLTAWLSGARTVTLSTVAMQSDISTRWISAAGTIVNLVAGAVLWLLLRGASRFSPAVRYFLVLAMVGNLFTGTGYFLFSGVANFGDWAAVIQGCEPHWLWRVGLIVIGVASYFFSMLLVAKELRLFRHGEDANRRMRALCWLPYFTDGLLATVAGLFNPAGLFYVIASAVPSTLGANAGLLSLPSMLRSQGPRDGEEPVAPIGRSVGWIATAAAVGLVFVLWLGRGITWSR